MVPADLKCGLYGQVPQCLTEEDGASAITLKKIKCQAKSWFRDHLVK